MFDWKEMFEATVAGMVVTLGIAFVFYCITLPFQLLYALFVGPL